MEGKGAFVQGRRAAFGLFVFIFTVIFPQLPAFAANVTVQWDPSPDPNVVGYNFYHGVASRTYTNIINVGNATTVTVSNLVEGRTYYFAATAYNLLGTESVFSDELVYTVPTTGNNPPTLNTIGNLTLSEDAAAQTVNLAGISTGSASETQTLTVTATSSNPGLVANPTVNYTSPSATGTLSFAPAANSNGTATISITVNDGQAQNNTVTRTFTVTVNAVNDSPTLNTLNNLTINEDAGAQTVNLAGIGTGAANETQTLVVTATSSNTGLIPNPTVSYSSPGATGSLGFTPVANANGTATITVTVNDGQAQNNTVTRTFTVTVNAVNDSPTLNTIGNLSLNENAGQQTVALAGIGTGAANETQTLAVTATSSNPGLIPNPTVNYTSPNATGTLAFTPVAGGNGSATITVTINDGQAQNNTVVRTFTVNVAAFVNVPPTLNAIGNLTLNEDAVAQTVNLVGIGSGSASETQTLTVTAISSNPGLVPNPTINYTSPNATGSLTITPTANSNGTATVTVTVDDGQASNNTISRTFTITVNAVNDSPTLNTLNNLTINEDAGAQTVNLAGIGTGAANETQTLVVSATSSNPGLIPNPTVNYSSPNATGTLSLTPVANANGTATITVTVNDGQAQNNTLPRTFTVTVNAVNDSPTLSVVGNLSLNENAGLQTVALAGIGTGAANETQTLVVTATSSNPGLIPNPTVAYTSPSTTGNLSFTPVVGINGTATITVTVNDGQAQNNIFTRTFVVGVNAVNDPPTLNAIGNLTLSEDAAAQTVNLAGISSGSASETQPLTVTATSSNPGLIPNPTVNYTSPNTTGSLIFTPAANSNGTATIAVTVDDGQASSNTFTRTFTVTVNAVNDSPTLNTLNNLTINEDAGTQTVNLAGIGTGAANETQTLVVTATSSNPGLIPNPTVNYSSPNASGSVSFTPVANASGTATITVTVNDGQAQNNTLLRTFTVTVNAVNDPPTLNAVGNLTLNENAGVQSVALAGIGTGAANETQTLSVTASSSNPGLIPNPTVSYTSPNATGSLSFTPVAGASGTATITVTVNDSQAQNNTEVRSFTVLVNAANRLPIISAITNVTIAQNTTSPAIPFTIGDVETAASNLTLYASSSNPLIVMDSGITLGGSDANRTVTIAPVADRGGETDITITVSDGEATASTTFHLTVLGPPAPPSSLTVVTNGSGSISGIPTTQSPIEGQAYTLTAVAGEGQMFVGWSGSTNSPSATLVVRARSNLVVQANFIPLRLTTNGNGTVTPNLKKMRNLIPGRIYSIMAMGSPGNMFVGWSGSINMPAPALAFVMRSNVNLQANFAPVNLTVSGHGTISPDLRKMANLVRGQTYILRALPGVGQEFAGWTGSTNSESLILKVVLATNLALQANFVPSPYIPMAGSYSGLFYEPDEVRRTASGFFSVNVTTRGLYSGWLQTATSRHSFFGKLKLDLRATNVITRPLNTPLTLELSFGSGAEIDRVAGRIVEPTWTANLSGDRVIFNVLTNPAPYAGNYTLVLPGQTGAASLPAGDGFGTVRVTTAGRATFAGTLGDGARVMQSVSLSKQGQWPLHSVLIYGTARGALLGWMNFANRPNDDLNGTLSWIKPANALDRFYPLGFDLDCQGAGSIYRTPVGPLTNYVLNLTAADVTFSGGNLVPDFSNSIQFGPYSRISNLSSNRLTLTFAPTLGTYSGSVVDPTTLKTLLFKGAVLQKQNAGFGLLTGTNKTSRVVIQAPQVPAP